ncbi:protein disulfide-isomerase TMX3 isoform X2 [Oncorhynchus kisutch]|uniref:protein disulfide-isomerase TMX3 isoform X2 n=1 Tax=Oncorhynchus kisutch TaxID=8019 RepID=UPI00099F5AA0|nr:protein disulfide-isomerase TMX3 isoform X2 [Oncorhynchus kisutch]
MGDTGKLVVLVVVEEKTPTKESIRSKTMVKRVATEYKDFCSKEFQFGHLDGNEYINGLIMEEVSFITVLNVSNDGYFLSPNKVETKDQLLKFIDGELKVRIKAPLLGIFLVFVFGFLLRPVQDLPYGEIGNEG